MAIRAISNIGINNSYNNVSFEGRRHRKHSENNNYSTSPLKVVPLAALIAMSPMVDTQDLFAINSQDANIEAVYGTTETEQYGFIPLPSNCKVLKDIHLEKPSGGYMGFKLINTDGNSSNYEMVEFTDVGATNTVLKRGILKAITITSQDDGSSNVRLYGINLSKSDLNNYAPQEGLMGILYPKTQNLANIFRNLIQNRDNNGAVNEISLNSDYRAPHRFPTDLKIYKNILGIN